MSENQSPAPGDSAAETAPLAASPTPPDAPSAAPAGPPAGPPAAPPAGPPAAAAGPVPTKVRWRERAFGLRSVIAVALAGLIVGAGAGVGTTLLAGNDHGDHPGRNWLEQRPGRGGFPGGPGGFGGPGRWGGDQQPAPPGSGQAPDNAPQDVPSTGGSSS